MFAVNSGQDSVPRPNSQGTPDWVTPWEENITHPEWPVPIGCKIVSTTNALMVGIIKATKKSDRIMEFGFQRSLFRSDLLASREPKVTKKAQTWWLGAKALRLRLFNQTHRHPGSPAGYGTVDLLPEPANPAAIRCAKTIGVRVKKPGRPYCLTYG